MSGGLPRRESSLSVEVHLPPLWQRQPRLLFSVGYRHFRLRHFQFTEAAPGNANLVGQCGDKPEQRGSTALAEVALLIVILFSVMEGVDQRLAGGLDHSASVKVGRNTKGTACASLAVRAVANGVNRRWSGDRDGSRAAGASGRQVVVLCRKNVGARHRARDIPPAVAGAVNFTRDDA